VNSEGELNVYWKFGQTQWITQNIATVAWNSRRLGRIS
jgi:hypothetical protein